MHINMRIFLWAPLSLFFIGFAVPAKAGTQKSTPVSLGSGKTSLSVILVDRHERNERGRWGRGRYRGDRDDYYYGRRYYYPNYGYYYPYNYYPYGYAYPYSYLYYGRNHSSFSLRIW
jgi:hypothetical protein